MSLRIPKSSQRRPGSKFFMRKSVFSCEQRWLPGPSRLSGIASHLEIHQLLADSKEQSVDSNILQTPVGDNSREPNLFRVVCYVRSKTENCTAKMPIRTFDNLVRLHVWLERFKHYLKTSVIELTTEPLEFRALSLTFTG